MHRLPTLSENEIGPDSGEPGPHEEAILHYLYAAFAVIEVGRITATA
jgi:hypothetical protein